MVRSLPSSRFRQYALEDERDVNTSNGYCPSAFGLQPVVSCESTVPNCRMSSHLIFYCFEKEAKILRVSCYKVATEAFLTVCLQFLSLLRKKVPQNWHLAMPMFFNNWSDKLVLVLVQTRFVLIFWINCWRTSHLVSLEATLIVACELEPKTLFFAR
jgi:hypothetical protein